MAQFLNLSAPSPTVSQSSSPRSRYASLTRPENANRSWSSLQKKLNCNGRFSCIFSDNRKEEQARKALESALGVREF